MTSEVNWLKRRM